MGIWVKAGSTTETETENGLSHFLEHMFFKGTEKRSYKQIAEEFDNIGAQSNAYTSKEMTCYYVRTIDEKLMEAVDILTDMFCNSVFPDAEVAKERGVILEEISMTLDTPDDLLMETLTQEFFKGTELSKTILGPAENIRRFTRQDMIAYRDKNYCTENVVVAAAGKYDEEKLLMALEKSLGSLKPCGQERVYTKDAFWMPKKGEFLLKKDIEQAHIGVSFPGPGVTDKERFAFSVASNILGGGMSSRLFQHIREEMGAAYSVYSYPSVYCQGGMLIIYAGTSPENVGRVSDAILKEIRTMGKEGISDEELKNAKVQLSASYILGQESSAAKMTTLGRNALLLGRPIEEEEVLGNIASVKIEDMERLFANIFNEEQMVKGAVLPKK
jgi:predicted Zn-dependent peptidase